VRLSNEIDVSIFSFATWLVILSGAKESPIIAFEALTRINSQRCFAPLNMTEIVDRLSRRAF